MNNPVILGTARAGRQSEKVAKFILEEVKKSGIETEKAMSMKPIASCEMPVYSEIAIDESMTHLEANISAARAMTKIMR